MSTVKIVSEYVKQKYFRRFHSRDEVKRYQEKKIKKHLNFVLKNSPFYRELYKNHLHHGRIEDWRSLPIIDKQMMMEHFNKLNIVGIKKEEAFDMAIQAEEDRNFSPTKNGITIGLSSGTSGNRGLFIVSPSERERWAGVILAKLLPHSLLHKHKIAFFLRANSNLYTTTQSKRIQFCFFDLMDDLSKHMNTLNQYEPSVLVAPPSMLRFLGKELNKGTLNISPEKVISVAEVLDPIDEQFLQTVFQKQIHQVYQCTEGFLACTCEHGTLHINEDIVAIEKEYLHNDKGRFFPIITDFSRTSQPIIRYRLNDILTEEEKPCPCGSPFMALKQIEGRADDIFYLKEKNGNGLKAIFPDFFRRAMMTASNEIEEYRLVQESIQQISVQLKLKSASEINESVTKSITAICQHFSVEAPKLVFKRYDFLPGEKKLRRIERSHFPIDKDKII
ncbi:adenylate cyclase [Bacillus aquiflavi]|uniref:Adenylate cyclase n=1 Tax=Bacillus aquiflavi TaxID=2672567 RepID=A0A6B3VW06_9BACI|nr:F390 synthetase-related protein [Bacillus aquiflavi]MBA4537983.1 adenylate cyclase [Bacillus aquiflavi]NEY82239.1 adenylate cyclase [Bacillus aquiflavi]